MIGTCANHMYSLHTSVFYFRLFCWHGSMGNLATKDLVHPHPSPKLNPLMVVLWNNLQCLRRYHDERDVHQLQNAGKYMSAMIAMVMRLTYSQEFTVVWRVLFIISSIIATIYALYWDLCVDWGLLNRHSKNKWLRDKIILKRKYLYFIAMVSIIPPISTHQNYIFDIFTSRSFWSFMSWTPCIKM